MSKVPTGLSCAPRPLGVRGEQEGKVDTRTTGLCGFAARAGGGDTTPYIPCRTMLQQAGHFFFAGHGGSGNEAGRRGSGDDLRRCSDRTKNGPKCQPTNELNKLDGVTREGILDFESARRRAHRWMDGCIDGIWDAGIRAWGFIDRPPAKSGRVVCARGRRDVTWRDVFVYRVFFCT